MSVLGFGVGENDRMAAQVRSGFKSAWVSVANGEAVVWPATVVAVVVALVSWAIGPKRGDVRVDVALASLAAFLFGVLLAFTIQRTRERLARVQDLIARGNASLFSIHQMVEGFDQADRERIRALVDRHLTDQIDYRLVDNHMARSSHLRLTRSVYALDPQTRQQEALYRELVALCVHMELERGQIESTGGQALSPMEWSGLLMLWVVLVGLIAVLPGGTVLGALVAGVLAGILVTFLLVLRKLDLLRWHERVTIWEPTARLFRSMGIDPYVPRHVIDGGRYRPTGRVRVVDYPDPYPNCSTKVVTLMELTDGFGEEPLPDEGDMSPAATLR
jgi:hypothetical protein